MFGAELQLDLRLIALQRLRVGVRDDELHALHALRDHVVDRVAAAAAHADHLDDRFLRLCIDEFDHLHLLVHDCLNCAIRLLR